LDTLQNTSESIQQPPRPSRRKQLIGIIGIFCISIVVIAYTIPIYPAFFPPTTLYKNSSAGFNINYPKTWEYQEQGGGSSGYIITFSSSQSIPEKLIRRPDQKSAWLIVIPYTISTSQLPTNVKPTSLIDVLNYVSQQYLSENLSMVEQPKNTKIGTFPAASAIYESTDNNGDKVIYDVSVTLHNDYYAFFMGVCVKDYWPFYRQQIEAMLQSVDFWLPKPAGTEG
jgi:hypothetical protein